MDKLDDINQSKEPYFFTQPSHNNSWEKTKKPRRPFWVVRFPNTCQLGNPTNFETQPSQNKSSEKIKNLVVHFETLQPSQGFSPTPPRTGIESMMMLGGTNTNKHRHSNTDIHTNTNTDKKHLRVPPPLAVMSLTLGLRDPCRLPWARRTWSFSIWWTDYLLLAL